MQFINFFACFNSLPKQQYSLAGTLLFSLVLNNTPAVLAQIQPDNSLGSETSTVSPTLQIRGIPAVQIEGGAIRGDNLFHSFREFNITEGTGAYFINPIGVFNIFSRVTGSDPSRIMGVLGVLGDANLFLLNPHGILFGPHARLDITGSLSASTGDRWLFDNGYVFSASNPQAPPLLTSQVPVGLQYGSVGSTKISNAGILSVGKDLILAGGSVTSTGQLQAPNGNVRVEAVSGDAEVRQLQAHSATLYASQDLNLVESQLFTQTDLSLQAQDTVKMRDSLLNPLVIQSGEILSVQGDQAIDIFALNHPESGLMAGGDLILRSQNQVGGDAHYWTGGNFRIEQLDGTLGDLYSPHDPIIRASGDVNFDAYSGASLHILAGGQVNIRGGVLIIGSDPDLSRTINPIATPNEATVRLSDGSSTTINGTQFPTLDIRAGTTAFGSTGIVNASTLAPVSRLSPGFTILEQPSAPPDINIGDIVMAAPNGRILLTNQYRPNSAVEGDINFNLNSTLVFNGINTPLAVIPGVGTTSVNSGSISEMVIDARGTANINAPINLSSSTGDAGKLTVLAKEGILINRDIASNTAGVGSAGNIDLSAPEVTLQNRAKVSVDTANIGAAGNINIRSSNQVTIQEGVKVSANTTGTGNAGAIAINNANQVTIRDGADVSVNTFGEGTGGTITVNSRQLDLQNTGQLSAITGNPTLPANDGFGGTIDLNVSDRVTLDRGFIFTGSNSLGNAGSFTVSTQKFIAQGGSLISASSLNSGQAGTVTLNAPNGSIEFIGNDRFEIAPSNVVVPTTLSLGAFGNGEAGSLAINTRRLTIRDGAQVYGSVGAGSPSGGFAADVTVNAIESVRVVGATPDRTLSSRLSSDTFGNANAGTLTINTPLLSVLDGGQISAGTTGSGEAGRLTVKSGQVQVSGQANASTLSRITFDSFGAGDAGGLNIQTSQLQVTQGGKISATAGGTGRGGVIDIVAPGGSVQIDGAGSGLFFDSQGAGNARGINITTGELQVYNKGEITVSSTSTGNAGDIQVTSDRVAIADGGQLAATINAGRGGNIDIKTGDLLLTNNGQISVNSNVTGSAGNVQIVADTLQVTDRAKLTATINSGQGGNVALNSRTFTLSNDALISVSGAESGTAGDIAVKAQQATVTQGANLSATIRSGSGGNINVDVEELNVSDNGQISVSSSELGNAGNIQVTSDKVAIANGGSLNATINSGQGGNISVTTEELTLANRGQISVSSNGSGDAGNIQVQADNVFMADGTRLIATITSGQGGNISLTVKDSIRLRRDSDIRTNAVGSGNGGNLFLQAGGLIFAVLSEDSDIIANAPEGRGGDITARAEGIFTFNDFQGEETPLSDFLNYGQQNGALNVDTRNPQPTPPLDDRLAGPDISPACAPNPAISSSTTGVTQFYQTGRGGVNPGPGNTVGGSEVQVPWGNIGTESNAANFDATEAQMSAIRAATGWRRNANGELVLVGPRSGTALSFCQSGRRL
ncbi:filamentous hemagglutinin N-terminal domain-containing protein [Trichocoleus sp. FACHB-262]|uniref:two-partner secretion domain-containing protein n=1 Tax=Trichocoleus sp. FACHB-262 TaxID=2692869 RepID=UPI001683E2A7|nr:filamentous hemagglutinin N-terminal domain-containing protein [Trichocoleus sp. FACHB-262]MBD2121058.1 filamentous hemagglutinin N-terminal domain-containing protein [Trichocoleus sp. FACHB-262]